MLYTTLDLLKKNLACKDGYGKLTENLGFDFPANKPIPLGEADESNIMDALWALRATTECSKEVAQEIALWCADKSLPIFEKEFPNDNRVRECIEATRKYLAGEIELSDLTAARNAAYRAAAYADDAAFAAAAAAYAADADAAAAAFAAAAYAADAAAYAAHAAAADAYAAHADAAAARKLFKQELTVKFKEILNK